MNHKRSHQNRTEPGPAKNQKWGHTIKFTGLLLIAETKDKIQVREIVKRKSVCEWEILSRSKIQLAVKPEPNQFLNFRTIIESNHGYD